jgi:hypothetical protein
MRSQFFTDALKSMDPGTKVTFLGEDIDTLDPEELRAVVRIAAHQMDTERRRHMADIKTVFAFVGGRG